MSIHFLRLSQMAVFLLLQFHVKGWLQVATVAVFCVNLHFL